MHAAATVEAINNAVYRVAPQRSEAQKKPSIPGRTKHCVDGGVVANNPTMAASLFAIVEDRIKTGDASGSLPAKQAILSTGKCDCCAKLVWLQNCVPLDDEHVVVRHSQHHHDRT